jgi:hypothetical protein
MADSLTLSISIRKRWYFYPAALAIVVLGRIGIIKDIQAASCWIARHCFIVTDYSGKRLNLFDEGRGGSNL